MNSIKIGKVTSAMMLIALLSLAAGCANNPNATLPAQSPHTAGSQHAASVGASTISATTH